MKERLILAVSWGAFVWACWCLVIFANVMSLDDGRIDKDFFSHAIVYISPAVWLVLWIVTGSSRILLWRK